MDFLYQIFLDIFVEGIWSLVFHVYLIFAKIFVPHKKMTEKTRNKIEKAITAISFVLLSCVFFGLPFLSSDREILYKIGEYMILIPLSIIGLQIILGILVSIVRTVKRSKK